MRPRLYMFQDRYRMGLHIAPDKVGIKTVRADVKGRCGVTFESAYIFLGELAHLKSGSMCRACRGSIR